MLLSIFTANFFCRLTAVGLGLYLSFRVLARWGNVVSAMAAGMLLTIACTHLIPEALSEGVAPSVAGFVLLVSFLIFAILDCALGRLAGHSHGVPQMKRDSALLGGKMRLRRTSCCQNTGSSRAAVLLLGMACHNFVDGVLIAAAFMTGATSGWLVTLAIFAHEVPQVMGQLVILTQSGWERKKAAVWTLAAAMSAVVGGVSGWALFTVVHEITGYAMLVSAASFIFVVLALLLPELLGQTPETNGDDRSEGVTDIRKIVLAMFAGVLFSLCILEPVHERSHELVHEEAAHVMQNHHH